MSSPASSPDIDPALAARLANAGPDDPVEALLLLKPEARSRLGRNITQSTQSLTSAAESPEDIPDMVRQALGALAPDHIRVRTFAALGALFVSGPASFVGRLLAHPDVISATLPDRSE